MTAADGSFNSPTELAIISLPPYSIRAGNHTAYARCADAGGNMGNFSTLSFVMHKEILVVFKTDEPEEDEALWVYYIGNTPSQLGFAWSYDIALAADLNSGLVNPSGYAVLMYADYQNGVGNLNTIRAFNQSGKYTMLMSEAFDEGPRELGITSTGGTPSNPDMTAYVMNNSHYITSGFNITTVNIYRAPQRRYLVEPGTLGTHLVRDTSGSNSKRMVVEVPSYRLLLFGQTTASNFNINGTTMATRAIDYAVNKSIRAITDLRASGTGRCARPPLESL
jgi:hypothetical protein